MMNKKHWTRLAKGRHRGKTLPEVLLSDPNWFFWALEAEFFTGTLAADAAWLSERAVAMRIPPDTDGTVREAVYMLDVNRLWDLQLIRAEDPSEPHIIRRKVFDLSIPYIYSPRDTKGGLRLINRLKVLLFRGDGAVMQGEDACRFFEDDRNFVLNN